MKAILTFHDLSTRPGPLSFAPAHFERLLDAIERAGTRVVLLEEMLSLPDGSAPVVAFTFDDGLVSVRDEALPRLAERGWPASCFVVTDFVGRDNRWPTQPRGAPAMTTLGWDDLGALLEGGIRVENHTRTHPDLRALDAEALADEIDAAQRQIEARLGRAPRALAYPYGRYDEAVTDAARARGLIGVTTDMGFVRREPSWRLPRVETCYLDAPRWADAWASRRWRAYLALRGAGRALGRRLGGA